MFQSSNHCFKEHISSNTVTENREQMKILPLLAVYIKYPGIVVHINHHISEINKKEMYAIYKHLSFGNMYFIPCDSHEIIPCKSLSVTDQGHKLLCSEIHSSLCVQRVFPASCSQNEGVWQSSKVGSFQGDMGLI